jgi:hypothetical protein
METGALNRPHAALESLVSLMTPPGAREAVLGDLCESYASPAQYMSDALRILPFVIVSQIRRNANLPALGLQGFLLFVCLGGLTAPPLAPHAAALTAIIMLGLMLREAYRAIGRQSYRRAMGEAILVALGLLLFCQSMSLGMAATRDLQDQALWLQLAFTYPFLFPVFCIVRACLLGSDGPAFDLSEEAMRRDYRRFERCLRWRNRIESVALAGSALLLLRLNLPYAGPALGGVDLFVAAYLWGEGAPQLLPDGLGFSALGTLYRQQLASQQQLRRFLCWLWFAPVLLTLHVRLVEGGFATGRSIMIAYGAMASVLLCFCIDALNREQGGRAWEKIELLERLQQH